MGEGGVREGNKRRMGGGKEEAIKEKMRGDKS